MIYFSTDSIFDKQVEALVNPVNCVGVMGKGLALEFKQRYPGLFSQYKIACKTGRYSLGHPHINDTGTINPKWIINFPTKYHYSDKSKIVDIETGMKVLCYFITSFKIKSIAIPALGCGLGGLQWNEVRRIIVESLVNGIDSEVVDVYLIEPK